MFRKMMLLAAGASALGLSTGAAAAPITYMGSQQVGSVLANYTIVTDGTLGDIGVNHLTGFNVTLSDSLSTTNYGRTISGGTGSASGTFLATATTLTIPFFESLGLYTNATNAAGSYIADLEFRYSTTYLQLGDTAHGTGLVLNPAEPNRTVPFATAVTSAVPEAATWAMMMVGLGIVGGSLRRRQKVSTRARFA